ncbi:hypothetical protein [Streptomyces sp. NPDC055210]
MERALEEIAFYSTGNQPSTAADELNSDARHLIDEASAYAYFSLTLLDIFSSDGLDRRTELAAAHGPDGDPERLADARQELGISPYSARPLIDAIRKAWSLPLGLAISSRMPRPHERCSRHSPPAVDRMSRATFQSGNNGR